MEKLRKRNTTIQNKNYKYEDIILSIMSSVHQSIDLQEVLKNAAHALRQNIEVVDHAAIFLVEGQEAVLRAYDGHPNWFVKRVKRIPYPKGLTWKTIIEKKPIYCDDVDKDTAIGPAGREVGIKSYLSMPISYNDKTIGCINVHSYKKHAFDKEETRLLKIVTQQIEIAVKNAKRAQEVKNLNEELNLRNKNLEILNTITFAAHNFLDIEEVYKIALDITEVLENIDMVMIYLVDKQRNSVILEAHKNLPQEYLRKASRIPYPKGVTWKVINSGKIINIENAQKDPDIGPAGKKLGHHGILGVPISFEEKTIGVIWFCSYKKHKFETAEADLLTSIGNQIAIAIAKANLYKELTNKNRYETIISSILRSVHQSIDLQDVMENAIDALRENIEAIEHLGIYIVEGDEAVLKAYSGLPDWFYKKVKSIPYPKGFIWNTIIEGNPSYVPDVDKDDVIGPAGKKFGTKSYLCVPIKSDRKTVGVLGIASLIKNAFDQDELKLLEIVASQIETAMNNARQAEELKSLYKELSHRIKDLESLNTINQTVHKFHDLEQVYETALDMTELIENVDVASIYLVDEHKKEAILQGQRNLPREYIKRASRIPYPKGATWKAILSGEIINIEDAQNHPDIGPAGGRLGHHGVMGVPIKFEEETIGVIWFGSYKKRKYDAQEVELLSSIGYQIATAIAKANLYRELMIKNRYETIISSILRSVHQSIDLQQVLENAVNSLIENVDKLDIAAIYLVEGKEAVLYAHKGYTKKFIKRAGRIPYPKGATWKAIIEGKSRYVPDADKDKYLGPAGREIGMKSYLSVPIFSQGKAAGTLNLVSFQKDAFDDQEDQQLLEIVAQQIEIAINNAQQAYALRESEERFHTIADTAPVMIWLSRPDSYKTYFNKFWLEFTGRTMEQEVGKGWTEGIHPDDLERSINTVLLAYEEEEEFKIEFRLRRFDGEYRWILVNGIPRTHADSSFAGYIGSCVDITDRKQMEENLEDKKSRLMSTFNSMNNAVIATDAGGSVTFMNAAAESLTGWTSAQAINKKLDRILKLKDIERKRLIKIPKEVYREAGADLSMPKHAKLIGKNRKETLASIEISNLKDGLGNVSGSLFIMNEIGEDNLAFLDKEPRNSNKYIDEASDPLNLMIGASSLLIQEGMSRILEPVKSINVVARTSDQTDIIPLLLDNRPDVLFFDSSLSTPDIHEILGAIKEHKIPTKVLLLIDSSNEQSIVEAISIGVRGCIAEQSNPEQLIQAIRTVGKNEIWMDVGLVTSILTSMLPKKKDETEVIIPDLTQKEEEIVKLVSQGLGNKQISSKLFISEITVKTHLRNVFKKLGISSRYELVKKFGS